MREVKMTHGVRCSNSKSFDRAIGVINKRSRTIGVVPSAWTPHLPAHAAADH